MAMYFFKNKLSILDSKLTRFHNIKSKNLALINRCKKHVKSCCNLLKTLQKKKGSIGNRFHADNSDNLAFKKDSVWQDIFPGDSSSETSVLKTIIVVSMVKNEEHIIESSIRWWMTFSDKVIVFNHHSMDRTLEIIHQLQAEFESRIILFNPSFDTQEYAQVKITNAMIEQAFNSFDADIVMPLDADEFPYLQNKKISMREYLSTLDQQYCYRTFWMQFAPLRSDEKADMTMLLPLSFHRKKCRPLEKWPKVIITRNAYKNGPVLVEKGNHTLNRVSGDSVERISTKNLCPDICYAHYMYQDMLHFRRKVTARWKACIMSSDYQPGVSEHYRLACEKIKEGTIDDDMLDYYTLSVSGMTGESMEEIKQTIVEIDPQTIFGVIRLRYTNAFK